MVSITHGLFSLSIPLYSNRFQFYCSLRPSHWQLPSANNVFKLPAARNLFVFVNYIHTVIDFVEQQLDLASQRMTQSWYIMQKSTSSMGCRGHHSTFYFSSFHEMVFSFDYLLKTENRSKVLIIY